MAHTLDKTNAAVQVAVLGLTLGLTGCAALLSRPTAVLPDWPPSPGSGRRSRRWWALTIGAALLFIGAIVLAVLAVLAYVA